MKRAKRIRKAIYGDMSLRQPRKYIGAEGPNGHLTLKNVGLRAEYQQAKKKEKNKKREKNNERGRSRRR